MTNEENGCGNDTQKYMNKLGQAKLDKKRLITYLNKFKSKVNDQQIEHRKNLSSAKTALRKCSDEFVKELEQSKNQLLDELDRWEDECLKNLGKAK